MKNIRGFAHILIILAIVVIGGVLLFGKNKQSLSLRDKLNSIVTVGSPVPTQASNPISDWKIYSDEALGFSVENPVGWFLKEGDKSLTRQKGTPAVSIASSLDVFTSRFLSTGDAAISVNKYKKSEEGFENLNSEEFFNLNNEVWQKRKNTSGGGGIPAKTYKVARIGEIRAVLENIVWTCIPNAGTECVPTIRLSYFIPDLIDKTLVWEISTEVLNNDPKKVSLETQVNKILSTFKFTN